MAKARKIDESELPEHLTGTQDLLFRESPTQISVVAHYTEGGEVAGPSKDDLEVIKVEAFEAPHAEIGVELGRVVNLGNYSTVRAAVTVKVPCYVEELDRAYRFAERFCKERLEAEVAEIVDWANAKGAKNNLF